MLYAVFSKQCAAPIRRCCERHRAIFLDFFEHVGQWLAKINPSCLLWILSEIVGGGVCVQFGGTWREKQEGAEIKGVCLRSIKR